VTRHAVDVRTFGPARPRPAPSQSDLGRRERKPGLSGPRSRARYSGRDVLEPGLLDPDSAIVRVDAATICGTHLHILTGDLPAVADGRILGHEAVGTVEQVGAVRAIQPGDRVLVSCISSCGSSRRRDRARAELGLDADRAAAGAHLVGRPAQATLSADACRAEYTYAASRAEPDQAPVGRDVRP
jgi:threonine dehydrogenase-like Zn-dependent dehydrogenase